MRTSERGFTFAEIMIAIPIGLLLLIWLLPGIAGAGQSERDAEAKAKLREIQILVERYQTDFGEYPEYLLGGDSRGWLRWHNDWDEEEPDPEKPANAWVNDPLIELGYCTSYPENPFVDEYPPTDVLALTSFTDSKGSGNGDPRFGFEGDRMACTLDDPAYFEDAHISLPYTVVETKRTLDRGKFDPTERGFSDRKDYQYPGLYYNFGGRFLYNTAKEAIVFWPGNFFYRSIPTIVPMRGGWSLPYPGVPNGGLLDNYMLGVWGAAENEGMDVIRLQNLSPDYNQQQIYWRYPPPWPEKSHMPVGYSGSIGKPMGLPTVVGGGDASLGPYWPPDRDPEHMREIVFGAPDGVKDGIILVITSDGKVMKEEAVSPEADV